MRPEPNMGAETDYEKLKSYEDFNIEEMLPEYVLQMDAENPVDEMYAVFLNQAT
jgi:hypothetical protein